MIDDLRQLNRLIATHWIGPLDADQQAYVGFTSACVGSLTHSAAELTQLLARLKQVGRNLYSVGELNRSYLTFARLAARDTTPANIDMLVRLGITLKQAAFLRKLSDDDLDRLAFGSASPMVQFAAQAFGCGVRLRAQVSKHHAMAIVTAQQAHAIQQS